MNGIIKMLKKGQLIQVLLIWAQIAYEPNAQSSLSLGGSHMLVKELKKECEPSQVSPVNPAEHRQL